MSKAKIISIAVAVILIVIVVLQNTESIETRILFANITMPRASLLFLTFIIGVGVGFIGATVRRKSKGKSASA